MTKELFTQLNFLPEGFLESSAQNLHTILPKPSLIHLSGRLQDPIFISVLLHGNETTGLKTIQKLLKKYQDKQLPRSVSLFTGNVIAAKEGIRRLEGQPDFNRVWPGTEQAASPESYMMQQVVDEMVARNLFASIDIHNNTGLNPHYACINNLDYRYLNLANLFSRLVVYFLRPKGVQSAAFAKYCPAVTLECGKPGHEYGAEHALQFLDACLHLQKIPNHEINPGDIDLFHTVAQVNIKEGIEFGFNGVAGDLNLDSKLDHMNFTEIEKGNIWGQVSDQETMPLIARNETGEDVTDLYFNNNNGKLVSTRNLMPSMLTLDGRIIEQDCLCYLMERIK